MITVVNKHTHKPHPSAIDRYIGRGSPLGNQWTHTPGRMHLAKYRAATRQEAIEKYAKWVGEQMTDAHSYVYKEIHYIAQMARTHHVNLVCYCAPLPCHGDVIKKIIEQINQIP
jgi:hypothetical protein